MKKYKCPGNMQANKVVTNPSNPKEKFTLLGFTGFPGFRYHPTKGLRKEAGFNHLVRVRG